MVAHNRLEATIITEIYFGDFTALLTMIRHREWTYFLFWRYCSGV